MKKLCILTILTSFVLLPPPARGQVKQFLPKIGDYSGEIELNGMYDSTQSQSASNDSETTDLIFRERLNLSTWGYFYHPRFVSFRIRGSGGIEEYSSQTSRTSRSAAGNSIEYDIRAVALPKHPYNLELFATRTEPLLTSAFSNTKPLRHQYGAYLRYRRRPWNAALGYVLDNTTQQNESYDSQTLRLAVNYFIRHFQAHGSYNHAVSEQPFNVEKTKDSLFLDSEASYKKMTLLSNWNFTQEEEAGQTINFTQLQRMTWQERLNMELPWNLEAELSFQMDTDKTTSRQSSSVPKAEVFTDARSYGFTLSHKLYESLRTGFSANFNTIESSGGKNEQLGYRLNATYRKNIHRGKISARLWTRYTRLDRSGSPSILDETHTEVGELEGFFLFNQRIDKKTIHLQVRDSLGFVRDFDGQYLIGSVGDSVEITILSFAPTPNLDPGEAYTFLVSYSFVSGQYVIASDSSGFSFRVALLDNLLQPFYIHGTTGQDLLEGIYPGTLEQSTTDTVGLVVQKTPFGVTMEYQKVQSEFNPENRYSIVAHYYKYFANYTKLFVDLEGEQDTFLRTEGDSKAVEITESVLSGDLRLQKRFPARHITLSLAGSYTWRSGLTESTIYSANSHLTWHLGKMDFSLGATYSSAVSVVNDNDLQSTTTLVYMNMKRKLF